MAETNVLSFALGLQAGGFIGPLGQASGALKGFVASALGFTGAIEGIFSVIEKGSALERLHRRTGEGVADLYELEKGFKAAGLEAEDVSPVLFKMEQSLGGVNEMGERTDDIFRRMGLDIRTLKKEDPARAMQDITKALGQFSQSGATKAAASIFGRGQGGNMVQLSRSSAAFAEGMAHAAKDAAVLARNAKTFERLSLTFDELKGKGQSFFLGLAEVAGPTFQKLADYLNGIDFSALGHKAGEIIRVLEEAFENARLGELLGDAMESGIEQGSNYFLKVISGWGAALQKIIANAIFGAGSNQNPNGKKGSTASILGIEAKQLGVGFLGAADLLLAPFMESAEDKLAERLNQYDALEDKLHIKQGQFIGGHGSNLEGAAGAFREGFANADAFTTHQATDKLAKLYQEIAKSLSPLGGFMDGITGKKGGDKDLEPVAPYHEQFTSLEKMGFVMKGLNNPAQDHARTTAQNTTRIARGIDILIEKTGRATGYDWTGVNRPV
jgi:hypothetical protein